MKQKILFIEAIDLQDVWFQLVINALHIGRDFKVDEGSFAGSTRKEFDFVVYQKQIAKELIFLN